ncbi:MAG: adenylate/guanylate cyclase domain-containing protein, partial [Acidimicrobiia bacterium]
MPSLPTGTVTFLFTDIEGSTRLWEEHPEGMKAALARHDEILRLAIEDHGGYVFSTAGDAFSASFHRAQDAVGAALAAQEVLVAEDWGDLAIGVRMGLHTGEADERDGDYFGSAVNRTARLLSAGHGGQVLVSRSMREIVEHQLADDVG